MPPQPVYRSQVLDHLGLVAGMFEELGIGEVIDQATQQNPEMRLVTAGQAVKAMVLNGLGCVNQQRSLVPQFFRNKPSPRLLAPAITAEHLHDDTLARALEMLYAYGVTALYRLMAATAAQRLGLSPTFAHLDSTSFHVDGRDNRGEAPDAQVIPSTQGYSRDHRPDLNHVMLDLMVEPQAGIPVLMNPLRGNRSEATGVGPLVSDHIGQLPATYGTTSLVADSALDSEDHLRKLSGTPMKWITRVPATVHEAQTALAQADPQGHDPTDGGLSLPSLGVDLWWSGATLGPH